MNFYGNTFEDSSTKSYRNLQWLFQELYRSPSDVPNRISTRTFPLYVIQKFIPVFPLEISPWISSRNTSGESKSSPGDFRHEILSGIPIAISPGNLSKNSSGNYLQEFIMRFRPELA